jgi:hypothetical protein
MLHAHGSIRYTRSLFPARSERDTTHTGNMALINGWRRVSDVPVLQRESACRGGNSGFSQFSLRMRFGDEDAWFVQLQIVRNMLHRQVVVQ